MLGTESKIYQCLPPAVGRYHTASDTRITVLYTGIPITACMLRWISPSAPSAMTKTQSRWSTGEADLCGQR